MKKRKGFTLIELLVVISIIALLLAILMPALGKVKEKARSLVCRSNQKQCLLVCAVYASENNDSTVPSWQRLAILGMGSQQWSTFMVDYYGGVMDMIRCPAAKFPDGVSENSGPADTLIPGTADKGWYYDNSTLPLREDGGYGYNCWLESDYGGASTGGANTILKVTSVSMPDNVPVLGDSVWGDAGWVLETDTIPSQDDRQGPKALEWSNYVRRYSLSRHGKASNFGFLDGHVDSVDVDELLNLKWHKTWSTPTRSDSE